MINNLPPIPPPDRAAADAAAARQAVLTKPPGALGRLEALSIQLAGMAGRLDWLPRRPVVIVCAGDHGVVAQGVSPYPQAVTQQMVANFLHGGAAVNVLARQLGALVVVVDAGVAGDLAPHPALVAGKVAYGTADFTRGPALTLAQAEQALALGLRVAEQEIAAGADIVAVGEMGIGNTSSAAALIAALTGAPVAAVAGRGAGLDDAGLRRKVAVIEAALALHAPAGGRLSGADALARLGGCEIGAMAGVMLGAAARRVPVLVDGVISTAAALVAAQLAPAVRDYLIAGHRSAEPGHAVALAALGLEPLLSLDLRLGEGTGALLALPLVEAAMRTLQEMATFADAGVSGPQGAPDAG